MNPPAHSIYWDLPILVVVVSLVYSATRYEGRGAIIREALHWGRRMTGFLGAIGLALYYVSWWINSGTGWWVLAVGLGAEALVLLIWVSVFEKK